jgi:ribosomal protein S18 acetylase RimI-like enzyme
VVTVIALPEAQRTWLAELLQSEWGSVRVVSRGRQHDASRLPAFLALWEGAPAGAATYRVAEGECEIITLNSLRERCGVGTALVEAVIQAAQKADCRRVWLVTTNDNMEALRFYQKRGFRMAAVYVNAIEGARRLKPEIPLLGREGIPIRDELEFELAC